MNLQTNSGDSIAIAHIIGELEHVQDRLDRLAESGVADRAEVARLSDDLRDQIRQLRIEISPAVAIAQHLVVARKIFFFIVASVAALGAAITGVAVIMDKCRYWFW